ncbi:MAG: NfeD family protein [Thermoplasmataceae archaeon]
MVSTSNYYLTIAIVAVLFFMLGAWLARVILRYPFGQGPKTGMEAIIGKVGVVTRTSDSYIEARIAEQYWKINVIGRSGVNAGDTVVVRSVNGNVLNVEKVER